MNKIENRAILFHTRVPNTINTIQISVLPLCNLVLMPSYMYIRMQPACVPGGGGGGGNGTILRTFAEVVHTRCAQQHPTYCRHESA